MTERLRVGVLGCGAFATQRMLPALRAHDGVNVVAVASRDRTRAARAAAGRDCVATDYDGLLARDDVSAVYVSVPPASHAEWTRRALAAGKHVLVEKPLATTAATARELVGLAHRQGLVLAENVLFPHHNQHRVVRGWVGDGRLGDVRAVRASFCIPPRPRPDIRYVRELGGGALLDLAGYPLRALRSLLADDLRVTAATLRVSPGDGVDMAGQALLVSAGGVLCHVEFGFEHCYGASIAVWGSRARLELDRPFTPPTAWRPRVVVSEQDHVEEFTLPADDQMANAIGAFVRSVTDRAPIDPADTLATAELVDQIRDLAVRVPIRERVPCT